MKRKNDGRRLRKEGVGTKGYEGGIEREERKYIRSKGSQCERLERVWYIGTVRRYLFTVILIVRDCEKKKLKISQSKYDFLTELI